MLLSTWKLKPIEGFRFLRKETFLNYPLMKHGGGERLLVVGNHALLACLIACVYGRNMTAAE